MLALAILGCHTLYSNAALALEKTSGVAGEATHTKAASPQLVLRIAATAPLIHPRSDLYMDDCIEAFIENRGKKPVTLVTPDEASDFAKRTPIIGISIIPASDTRKKHPATPPQNKARHCGNFINRVSLFAVAPGRQRQIGNLKELFYPFEKQFHGPGRYRVVFYYTNDPTGKLLNPPGKPQPPDPRIPVTTACVLRSNEIILTVAGAPRHEGSK